MTDQTITLLGPQRRPSLDKVVRSLGFAGPFATINAGWMERERDDAELDRHLLGRSVNLHLWSRVQNVLEGDPEFAAAHRRRGELLDQLQDLYLVGLIHVKQALRELRSVATGSVQLRDAAVHDAQLVLRNLDRQHLARVREVQLDFYALTRPHERPEIMRHRGEVAHLLEQCEAVVLPGGHVGELLDALHLFNVVPAGLDRLPIIAWSAGAMVLTEHVVLFNDNAVRSTKATEVFDIGLDLLHDVVVFPNARRRLDFQDRTRMAGVASRFRPARCVPLDPGFRATIIDRQWPTDTKVFGYDGTLVDWEEVPDAEAGNQPSA